MNGRYFIDTNVFVYSFDRSAAERYRLSWYDSLILAAAIEAGCSVVYSEDLQDGFAAGGVKVMNPFR
jgi:predicted nucleic acid-binding protein